MYRSLAIVLLLAAPASARQTELGRTESALHGYVLGRYAASDDALGRAAAYFDDARAKDPGRPALARRAFDLAVAAGDRPRATELAKQLVATGIVDSDIEMIRLSDAVLRKDWKGVSAARARIANAGYAAVVGPIVDAWVLYGSGKPAAGIAVLDPVNFSGFARAYIAEQRAHMLAADGQWSAAAAAYSELRSGSGAGIGFLRVGEADALAMSGDRAGAMQVLSGDDITVTAARGRLEAGKRIGALAPDPRRGTAWMMARLAADLSREKPVPLALLFARASTFLAPDISATWLITGDVLSRSDQQASALLAYAQVPAGDPLFDGAKQRRAEVLEKLGRDSDAGALLKAAAGAPGATADDWTRLGDWHRRADRHADAIAAYTRAIAVAGEGSATWGLYFLRGSMFERAGDWPKAEADLRKALALSPDEPIVLNYLGYSMLDRGMRSPEAAAMVERAAMLRPGDGGVIDSLGWSQYRQGKFTDAVASLEKAIVLEPTDPTVSEHLGDAYWRTGRRIEARFRWRAALDLDPTAAQATGLRGKLDYGLDAAPAMTANRS